MLSIPRKGLYGHKPLCYPYEQFIVYYFSEVTLNIIKRQQLVNMFILILTQIYKIRMKEKYLYND